MFSFSAGSSVCASTVSAHYYGQELGQGQLQSWERSGLGRPGPNWAEIKPGSCLHCAAA